MVLQQQHDGAVEVSAAPGLGGDEQLTHSDRTGMHGPNPNGQDRGMGMKNRGHGGWGPGARVEPSRKDASTTVRMSAWDAE
ncbi:hypothetical protein GCM10025789_26200 [Tessaracoccus lubricantis]|uniref:Uncharacterized protein n=1 Tax=Tessaracoccus lubricantis TaxID=545543 RepID=A0ABP9FLB5_9ACTN